MATLADYDFVTGLGRIGTISAGPRPCAAFEHRGVSPATCRRGSSVAGDTVGWVNPAGRNVIEVPVAGGNACHQDD